MRMPEQKQKILDAFAKIGITPIIKKARLGGWFIYHKYGTPHKRSVKTDIEQWGNETHYKRAKVTYYSDWISDNEEPFDLGDGEIINEFNDLLEMCINEAINRKAYYAEE